MVRITIDELDAEAADELRIRALANDCSLEEEARQRSELCAQESGDTAAAQESRHGHP